MKDSFGREINYMRISITDRCNLRCRYCMPTDIELASMDNILTFEEILQVVKTGVKLGICDFKITGGEPLVRRGVMKLLTMIKNEPGVKSVSLTTNGVLLSKYAKELVDIGVTNVNVSLDTVNEKEYENITGVDALSEVKKSIETGIEAGLNIKLNAVAYSLDEVCRLTQYASQQGIVLRFIELMPIGYGRNGEYISNEKIMDILNHNFGKYTRDSKVRGKGPAVYYNFEKLCKPIGFISAVHDKFCDSCNRVRLTSMGYLKTCLCYDHGTDLRGYIRDDGDSKELLEKMKETIFDKPRAHCFDKPSQITEINEMSKIGG